MTAPLAPPTGVEATPINTTSVRLVWQASLLSGATYKVTYIHPDGRLEVINNLSGDSLVIHELIPGSTYSFTITLVVGGVSSESTTTNVSLEGSCELS